MVGDSDLLNQLGVETLHIHLNLARMHTRGEEDVHSAVAAEDVDGRASLLVDRVVGDGLFSRDGLEELVFGGEANEAYAIASLVHGMQNARRMKCELDSLAMAASLMTNHRLVSPKPM